MNFTGDQPDNATELSPLSLQVVRVTVSIYGAFIIVFGCLGNMVSLRIFWNTDVFKESTHFLLIILQIADTCVLLLVVSRYWIQQVFSVDIRNLGYPVCLAHVVLTYLCVDFATWVLVFIVLDRFLAVSYPIRARLIMTKTNVVKLLVCILVLLCVKDLPLLLSHQWQQQQPQRRCMYRGDFFQYYLVADSLLNFVLPDALLLIFNMTIFCSIRRHARRMSLAAGSSITAAAAAANRRQQRSGERRKRKHADSRHKQMAVARVALVSGTIHLVTTMPSATYLLSHSFITYSGTSFLVNNILLMLSYTNSAINFLIYLPMDGRFRTSFNTMVTPECSNAVNNNFNNNNSSSGNGGLLRRVTGSKRFKRGLLSPAGPATARDSEVIAAGTAADKEVPMLALQHLGDATPLKQAE